jgi:hypothetical protein
VRKFLNFLFSPSERTAASTPRDGDGLELDEEWGEGAA